MIVNIDGVELRLTTHYKLGIVEVSFVDEKYRGIGATFSLNSPAGWVFNQLKFFAERYKK